MSHAVVRTSPTGKGEKFVGQCTKCGEKGLGMGGALEPCPQDDLVSDETALIDILQKELGNE